MTEPTCALCAADHATEHHHTAAATARDRAAREAVRRRAHAATRCAPRPA